MEYQKKSIRKRLMRFNMLVSCIVVLITCLVLFLYEFYSFRQNILHKLSTYGEIISNNSTAALAFDSKEDAEEILSALKAEPRIIAAAIYDSEGNIFCSYPADYNQKDLPSKQGAAGYRFTRSSLEGFQPIVQGKRQLGTLYLRSDLKEMYSSFELYGLITLLILGFSFSLAYFLSMFLEKSISRPILALAGTAKVVSERKDYSLRATKYSEDEVGSLTDAFNEMLIQIEEKTETLNEFNQNLEKMVADRTKELETVNKELESFSYSVSHDLRAPVRAIHGYINIFMEDYGEEMDEEAKKLIHIIEKNGKKMGMLIDDLLAFSQLGRKELIKANISMDHTVREIWEDLYKPEPDRTITLDLKTLPDAYAEKSTIKQVWVNLISNALKYTKKQKETLIQISGEEKDGEIIYSIKDNGSGFDMEFYKKLFGVFQRLHSQEEFEGTGVGLAIVERIVQKHGGKIWAEGKVNEGATFYFTLMAPK